MRPGSHVLGRDPFPVMRAAEPSWAAVDLCGQVRADLAAVAAEVVARYAGSNMRLDTG